LNEALKRKFKLDDEYLKVLKYVHKLFVKAFKKDDLKCIT